MYKKKVKNRYQNAEDRRGDDTPGRTHREMCTHRDQQMAYDDEHEALKAEIEKMKRDNATLKKQKEQALKAEIHRLKCDNVALKEKRATPAWSAAIQKEKEIEAAGRQSSLYQEGAAAVDKQLLMDMNFALADLQSQMLQAKGAEKKRLKRLVQAKDDEIQSMRDSLGLSNNAKIRL